MPTRRIPRLGRRALLVFASVLSLNAPAEIPPVAWHDNYDAAIAAGISQKRPILILFDAPTSSTRRKNLLPSLESDPAFADFASRQLVLGVVPAPGLSTDTEAERRARQLRANHGVGSLPALVLLDPDGRTLGSPSLRPRQSTQELVRMIDRMIPDSLRAPAPRSGPSVAASGPLTIDLSAGTNIPTAAVTIDLGQMRREGSPPSHPSLIILQPGEVSGTNFLNRRLPR